MPTSADTQTWQRLAQEAQTAWMNGDSDRAGDLLFQLHDQSMGWLLQIARAGAPADTVEELVAETFLQFYKLMSAGKPIRNAKALLGTILRRRIVDMRRQRGKVRVQPFDDTTWAELSDRPDVEDTPEEVIVARETARHATNVILDALPIEERQVLIARHMRSLSVKETAQHLHLTEDQVKKRLQHAMARALHIAEERGLL